MLRFLLCGISSWFSKDTVVVVERGRGQVSWNSTSSESAVGVFSMGTYASRVTPGRITGRVINPDGLPLKNADVELFRRERYKDTQTGWWTVQSDEMGYFEFDHVTPGLYVTVFNNSNKFDPNLPWT